MEMGPEKSVTDQYRPEMKNGRDFGMGCGPLQYAIVEGMNVRDSRVHPARP
jgi:hypothetical protein